MSVAESKPLNAHVLQALRKRNMVQPAQRTEVYISYVEELEGTGDRLSSGSLQFDDEPLLVLGSRLMCTGMALYWRRRFEEAREALEACVTALKNTPAFPSVQHDTRDGTRLLAQDHYRPHLMSAACLFRAVTSSLPACQLRGYVCFPLRTCDPCVLPTRPPGVRQ